MKCQHQGCQIDQSYLICGITSKEVSIFRCPTHVLMDLKNIVVELQAMKPFEEKCECCGKSETYIINYGGDGDILLCLEDIIAFLEFRLAPVKFKALYEKYPNHYMLHDDFYDAVTGEALQPSQFV